MAERGSVSHVEHELEKHTHAARYATVWIALLVLTIVTWGASRFHIPGGWGVAVALAIAIVKGSLVALFFMHLWDQRGANRLVFVTSVVFVALLIGLTLSDNASRFPLANPPGTDGAMPLGPRDYSASPPRSAASAGAALTPAAVRPHPPRSSSTRS